MPTPQVPSPLLPQRPPPPLDFHRKSHPPPLDFHRKILERSGTPLFNNTSVKPKDVGILVVNCSLFNPIPSLSAMIVNRYKMRGNIRSFNLGGMGIRNWYFGNKKSMLVGVSLSKDLMRKGPCYLQMMLVHRECRKQLWLLPFEMLPLLLDILILI